MKRLIGILAIALLLFACTGKQQNKNKQEIKSDETSSEYSNYAVVWETVKDKSLILENAETFSKELLELWEKGSIENVYFDVDAEEIEGMQLPAVSHFLKAKDKNEAIQILDSLTIVKKKIGSYKLHPVGMLWLSRNDEHLKASTETESFVAVWETQQTKAVDDLTKAQNDYVLSLWNKGIIENVYFDIDGVSNVNDKTDFVFYINAENVTRARKICESLPFSREGISTYKLFDVGVFWLGINNSNNPK